MSVTTMSLREAEKTIMLYMWSKIYTQEGLRVLRPWRFSSPAIPAPGTLTCSQVGTAVHKGFQGGGRLRQQGHQHANMAGVLFTLRELHAYILQVDPISFKLLSHCPLVMVTLHFPEVFWATAHAAWDKFLSIMSCVLTEK
ncbi:hemoglobin subunit zeta-like [Ursus maritimus]|uniref:Hemoglobin subunit zeta n=2 Tax=Ursus maritimus TaxID=29073 RepID=A0A384CAZ2_URSMA|nr:hemoglobin subunit zeta-like [Ursus maritimus]